MQLYSAPHGLATARRTFWWMFWGTLLLKLGLAATFPMTGDEAFFYHSREGLEVVGICTVSVAGITDPTDETGKWAAVKVKAKEKFAHPVTLVAIKASHSAAFLVVLSAILWLLVTGLVGRRDRGRPRRRFQRGAFPPRQRQRQCRPVGK
mgnify:CR=1 FL=1